MRADATKFLNFLHKANQFVIPIYQRNYSWDEKQCQQLWEDILRVGSNESIPLLEDLTVHIGVTITKNETPDMPIQEKYLGKNA